ncbi:MAG: transporter substrate-binding domain-containing protein [Geminicoccales bacterium]
MKRRSLIQAGAALAALPLFHAIRPGTALAGDLELIEPGVLSTATEGSFPPFSIRDASGDLGGFELEIIREIASRLGLEHKPVIIKWDSILIGLEADQYDVISNPMGITKERQQAVTFCDAWVESGARLVVRDNSDIAGLGDANGKTVGVIVASTFVPMAEKLGGEVRSYKSDPEALQDLANGNIDAVITDAVAGAYAIKEAGLPLKLIDGYIESYQMGWAVKNGKPNLVTAINGALAAMIEDGTFASIANGVIGLDPTPEEPIRSII